MFTTQISFLSPSSSFSVFISLVHIVVEYVAYSIVMLAHVPAQVVVILNM